jgi:hypothetical protein
MTKRGEPATPKNLSELRSMIAARSVIFPDQVESVVRKALAEPELIAFGSSRFRQLWGTENPVPGTLV